MAHKGLGASYVRHPSPHDWILAMRVAHAITHGAFVVRSASSGALAYLLADSVGLLHPVWAPMSALIVTQERLSDTRASLSGRLMGTVFGMAAAVAVDSVSPILSLGSASEIALAVALCAPLARRRPALRVSMWTGPIVLLTSAPESSVAMVAFFRGAEVVLGSVTGGVVHAVFDVGLRWFFKYFHKPAKV